MPIPVVPRQSSFDEGPSGIANVRVSGKKITINFLQGADYTLDKDALPEDATLPNSARAFVKLTSRLDRIMTIHPTKGTFFGRFAGFSKKQDAPPTLWRSKPNPEWENSVPGLNFTAQLRVDKKQPFAGCIVAAFLPYKFTKFTDAKGNIIAGIEQGRGKGFEKFIGFLEATGIDLSRDTLNFSDNVLADLEPKILKRDPQFTFTLAERQDGNGVYVASIAALPKSARRK